MKQTNINLSKGTGIITAALVIAFAFSSCKKETASDSVTDDEVAEVVTESVSASSGGMVTQSESSAQMAATTTLACGGSSDTTIVGTNATGAATTYNYSLKFSRSLVCTNGIPSQFNANFTGTSSYTALRMSSSDNSNAQVVVTGIQPSTSAYVLNENFVRNGTQQSSVRNKRSFASTVTIVASNITVNKSSLKIVSGTATVQLVATTSDGYSITKGGTLTFLGSGKATLVLDNGGSYSIQW